MEGRVSRHRRARRKIKGTDERPRLSVRKTGRHIYAQIVDDGKGATLAFLTTNRKAFKGEAESKNLSNKPAARKLGLELAQLAASKGVSKVVFDRGGLKYHGVVKELADAAREGGLEF